MKLIKPLISILLLVTLVGCASSKEPTALERHLFNVNTQMVNQVVSITNVIPIIQTNFQVQTVTVTNTEHQVITVTNVVPTTETVYRTNLVSQTNVIPQYQFTPGTGSTAITQIGGAVAAPFGFGGIVTTALAGIFGVWMSVRNNRLKGETNILTDTSAVLTQNIETLMEILKTTPQGASLIPLIKNYLISHQSTQGVIDVVATVLQSVDNTAAKEAAAKIKDTLQSIKNS